MSDQRKILIVEDEADIAALMQLHLVRAGHEVSHVTTGDAALNLANGREHDLVILDWMLPGLSGLEVCRKLRALRPTIPILMVTARANPTDIVAGLETGADDYLTKPFELLVFLARVTALLRRANATRHETTRFVVGEVALEVESRTVSISGKPLALTPSEFKLLHALMKNQGRVLTRGRLIDLVHGEDVTVVDRAIDTHVFGLRKKLGKTGDVIETIRGIGYRVK